MKYDKLKDKLLRWYETQRVDSREAAHEDFRKERMRSSDTCVISCLRLEQLAAYGRSREDLDRKLRGKLMKTAPDAFCQQIENAESVFSIVGDGELSWKKLKKLAEKYDRKVCEADRRDLKHEERKSIFFGLEMVKPLAKTHRSYSRPRVSFADRDEQAPSVQERRVGSSRGRSTSQGRMTCQFCKKGGHSFDNCWVRLKRCLLCGSGDHWMKDCPNMRRLEVSPFQQRPSAGQIASQSSDSDSSGSNASLNDHALS